MSPIEAERKTAIKYNKNDDGFKLQKYIECMKQLVGSKDAHIGFS